MPTYTVSIDCVATVYDVKAKTPEEALAKAAHQIEFGVHPDNMDVSTRDWDESCYEIHEEE